MRKSENTATALRDADKAQASEAARMLGSIRTERKAATSRENLKHVKNRYRPTPKDPLELPCTCGAGTQTEVGTNHKTTCPRGRLLYQRAKIAARSAGNSDAAGTKETVNP